MGGGQEKTSTQISKIELPEWVNNAAQENYRLAQAIGSKPYQPYTGDKVAGLSDTTNSAIEYLKSNVGRGTGAYDAASGALNGLLSFNPSTMGYDTVGSRDVTAGSVGSSTVGADQILAGIINPERLANADLSKYLNPYVAEVEKNALAGVDRQGLLNMNKLRSNAVSTGAFGGSRQGIAEGIMASETARQAGDLSAQLRAAGYDKAIEGATGDISRNLTAQTSNVGNRLQAGTTSANNKLTADLSNANNRLDADKFNVSSRLSADTGNADRSMQGALANQSTRLAAETANQRAMLEAAGIRQNAATGLTGVADAQRAGLMADVGGLLNAGNVQQSNRQAQLDDAASRFDEAKNYDTERLNLLLASLGMTPYGRTETTNKTETSSGGQDWATAALGGFNILKGLGAFSDDKAKTDKEFVGEIGDSGIEAWAYRYKKDPKTYPKVVGVMASQLEKVMPKAVKKIGKRRIVDYTMLQEVLEAA